MRRTAQGFWKSEQGAVAAEFVIVLPLLVAFFLLIASSSALYATATELQQISFELARMSVRYAEPGRDMAAVCTDLINNQAATAYQLGYFINEASVRGITCQADPVSRVLTVSIVYDLSGHLGATSGRLVGLDIESLTRTARLQL